MDRSSKQKINKETQVLNDTLDEMDLIDIFRTFHPNAEEYTFFSRAHGTFSRIDHILGHKSNLSKFKKIEIVSSFFSDHNAMRQDINYKEKKSVRNTNTWRLNNTFLNNQPTFFQLSFNQLSSGYWRNQKGNRKISRNKWQWKHDSSKLMGCSKSSSKRESEWSCSDFSWPHGLQPTRLLHPWDFPGKSTGVGCHRLLQLIH